MTPSKELQITVQNPYLESFYRQITPQTSWGDRANLILERVSTRFQPDQDHRTQIPIYSEMLEVTRILPQIPDQALSAETKEQILDAIRQSEEYLETFYSSDGITPENVNNRLIEEISRVRKAYKGKDVEYFVMHVRKKILDKAHELEETQINRERIPKVSIQSLVHDVQNERLRSSVAGILTKYITRDLVNIGTKDILEDIENIERMLGERMLLSGKDEADINALTTILGLLYTQKEERTFHAKKQNARTYALPLNEEVQGDENQGDIDYRVLYPGYDPSVDTYDSVKKTLDTLTLEFLNARKQAASGTLPIIYGRRATWADHIDKLIKFSAELAKDTPTQQFISLLEDEISGLSEGGREQFIERFLQTIKEAGFVGKKPDVSIIPEGVNYLEIKQFLYQSSRAKLSGLRTNMDAIDALMRDRGIESQIQEQTGLNADQAMQGLREFGGRGLEQYFFIAEIQERLSYIKSLSPQERDYALTLLLGEMSRTQGSAQVLMILIRAWFGDPSVNPHEANKQAGFNHVHKVEQGTSGYLGFEDFYKTIQYVKSQERAAVYDSETDGHLIIHITDREGRVVEDRMEYRFIIGIHDHVATLYDTRVMPEILASREEPPTGTDLAELKRKFNEEGVYDPNLAGYSMNAQRWFVYTILFKMGFSKEDALCMADNFNINGKLIDKEGKLYDCKWTDRINIIDMTGIDTFGDWVNTNWWIVSTSETLLLGDRVTYLYTNGGEDFRRRKAFGWRKTEDRSGYYNQSGRFMPGERVLNGPQFLLPIDQATPEEALTQPIFEMVMSGNAEIDNIRKRHICQLTDARMIPPEYATEMGTLMLGVDKYKLDDGLTPTQKKDFILTKIDEFMREHSDSRDYSRITPFEFWQYVNIDTTTEEFRQAWGTYDFEPLLRKCGFVDGHFRTFRKDDPNATVGGAGWKLFISNASANLLRRDRLDVQKTDSHHRYNAPKEEALQKVNTFLDELRIEFKPRGIEKIPLIGRGELQSDVHEYFRLWRDKVRDKLEFPDMSNYITNTYQQVARNLSVLRCFSQGHGAWNLDTYVPTVDLEVLKKTGNFFESQLTRGEFRLHWLEQGLTIEEVDEIEHRLNYYGFFFSASVEKVAKDGDGARYAHGPHFSYVPRPIKASAQLDNIINYVGLTPTVQERARILKRQGIFGWPFLIQGASPLGAGIIEAIMIDKTNTERVVDLQEEFREELRNLVKNNSLGIDVIIPETTARIHIVDPENKGLRSQYRTYLQQFGGLQPHFYNKVDTRANF